MNVSGIGGFSGAASAMGLGRPPGPPPTDEEMQAKISDYLTGLDADGNGSVNLEESGVSEADFAEIDADGDGEVTAEELLAFMNANRPPPPPFAGQESDEVSDSQAAGEAGATGSSATEEGGLTEAEFDEMDTNEDGVVSLEELVAYLQAHRPPPPEQSAETGQTSQTGAMMYTRQQAIEAYSQDRNELVTSLFDYLQNGSQNSGFEITV